MCKKKYSEDEVQEIVSNALDEQAAQFKEQKEKEELNKTINNLIERIEKLEKSVNKVGF